LDLWSYGRFNLSLSENEFWHLTLAQFYALRRCYQDNEEWLDYRSSQICAMVANTVPRKKGSKVFSPKDFMPKTETQKHKRMTDEEMLSVVKRINKSLGGEVKEV
jgi:hypothetical protein